MGRVKDTKYVNPQDVYNYLTVEKGLSTLPYIKTSLSPGS
jgi:hypothetical protein